MCGTDEELHGVLLRYLLHRGSALHQSAPLPEVQHGRPLRVGVLVDMLPVTTFTLSFGFSILP